MARMGIKLAGFLALSMAGILAGAAPASAQSATEAEKLRRMDIMLMVTSLRCRAGVDDFQADFAAFEARHMRELNAAAAVLRRNAGGQGDRVLDKISTTIANRYGSGHPWLACHELKELTRQLAVNEGAQTVLEAADQVFEGDTRLAMGR